MPLKLQIDIKDEYNETTVTIMAKAWTEELAALIKQIQSPMTKRLVAVQEDRSVLLEPGDIDFIYAESRKVFAPMKRQSVEIKMKAVHYLIGMWLPYVAVVCLQSAVLLSFGHFVYGLELGSIPAVALVVAGLAVCATGLGLLFSMLVSSANMGIALVQVIAMGGAIAGGLWFPYAFLPKAVQMIGKFTPQYWAQQGMQEVMLHGAGLADLGAAMTVLLGFGLAALLLSAVVFRRFAGATV